MKHKYPVFYKYPDLGTAYVAWCPYFPESTNKIGFNASVSEWFAGRWLIRENLLRLAKEDLPIDVPTEEEIKQLCQYEREKNAHRMIMIEFDDSEIRKEYERAKSKNLWQKIKSFWK